MSVFIIRNRRSQDAYIDRPSRHNPMTIHIPQLKKLRTETAKESTVFRDQVLNQENISGIIIPNLTILLLKLYRTLSFIPGYPLLQNFLISLIHHAQLRTCYKSSQNAQDQTPSKSKEVNQILRISSILPRRNRVSFTE